MRGLGIVLLGTVLLLPVGCKEKTDEKSPAKTETAADVKTQDDNTAAKTREEVAPAKTTDPPTDQKGSSSSQTAADDSDPEPVKLPRELAALAYAPNQSIVLVSARPNAVLDSPLVKSLEPLNPPIDRLLKKMQQESGINPRDVERVSLAVWMAEGHALPGRGLGSKEALAEPIDEPAIEAPKSPEPPRLNPEPGFPKREAPKVKAPPKAVPPIPEPREIPAPGDCNVQPGDEFGGEFEEHAHAGPGGAGFFGLKMDAVVIVQFNRPFDPKQIEAASPTDLQDVTHKGITYRADFDSAYYMPNVTTLLLSPRGDMPTVLDNQGTSNLVQSAVKKGLDHDFTVLANLRDLRNLLQGPAIEADQEVPGLAELPRQLEKLYVHLDVDEGVKLNATLDCNTEAGPKTIKTAFDRGYGFLGQKIGFVWPDEVNREFGEELGTDLMKLASSIYAETEGEAAGKQFHLTLEVPASATDLVPKLVKRQQEIAKAMVGINDMKMIGLAVHNYHETFQELPFPNGRSTLPEAEKNKLSWRVHILPYLDEYPLYEKFKLDEAWDSDHNKALLAEMPDVYKLSENAKEGHTQFVLPAGKGFFGEDLGKRGFRDVIDGTSNTLMGVTVVPDKAVPWTKPGGFELDPKQAAKILGGHDQGFLALFGDGRVQPLDPSIDAETLKALLTIAGSEIVDYSDYETRRGRR